MIDDSHSDRTQFSLTAVHCLDVGKQPVAWKDYSAEHCGLKKKLLKNVDRCTNHHDITEIMLKTASNTTQSINQL